jgi:Fic family protein
VSSKPGAGHLIELEGEKTEQTIQSLAAIWKTSDDEAARCTQLLVEIGFFQPRGGRDHWTYWVPFLYRDALAMSQGIADETE